MNAHQRDLRQVRPRLLDLDAGRLRPAGRRQARAGARHARRDLRRSCLDSTRSSSPAAIPAATRRRSSCRTSRTSPTRVQRHHPRAKIWLSLQWFDAKRRSTTSTRGSTREPAGLARRPRRRAEQPAARRDARAARPALSAARLPGHHAHRARPSTPCPSGTRRSTSRSAASRSIRARSSTRRSTIALASHTDGFISYSDGVNDDVNKTVWSR